MKYLKLFENFKDTHTELEEKLKEYGIKNYTINDDGTVDVNGDCYLSSKKLEKIPFKFGKVNGDFNINNNMLESLVGCPYYVGGYFSCSANKLINLKGSPGEVGGNFSCTYNKLESLEGMSLEIGKDFFCYNNPNLKELDSISNIEGKILCDLHVDVSKFRGFCKDFRVQ